MGATEYAEQKRDDLGGCILIRIPVRRGSKKKKTLASWTHMSYEGYDGLEKEANPHRVKDAISHLRASAAIHFCNRDPPVSHVGVSLKV